MDDMKALERAVIAALTLVVSVVTGFVLLVIFIVVGVVEAAKALVKR
jgi:hypothetical protein